MFNKKTFNVDALCMQTTIGNSQTLLGLADFSTQATKAGFVGAGVPSALAKPWADGDGVYRPSDDGVPCDSPVISRLCASVMVQREMVTMPIMRGIADACRRYRPFVGQRVALSHVMVPNTLPLILSLLQGGARLVVSNCFPPALSKEVLALLRTAGVSVELSYPLVAQAADFVLDCGGSLAGQHKAKGVVEVTRTGYHKYKSYADETVIVNIDDSLTKYIEDFFGTSTALIRALNYYLGSAREYLGSRTVAVVGFGKVGRGIASQLKHKARHVVVLDVSEEAVKIARRLGFEAVLISKDVFSNTTGLKSADIVISCTGHKGAIGASFDKKGIENKLLINMGAEDEFGDQYSSSEIFHSKETAINFNLNPPTENMYIDAILAAQIEGLYYLINHKLAPGLHLLPRSSDRAIVDRFCGIHQVSFSTLRDYFEGIG
ncbi:MAG: NAD-binding protein [Deltaproteobacteria bacterium]|nr:NAD-binding protein [Deltaproteobacteria bacterium]